MTPVLANLGSPSHWFILFVLVLLVFGAKRMPEVARGLARSLAEFRKAKREFEKELTETEQDKPDQPKKD
ncbi:MAG: twin-arginine translocase TatA/TatE family subunit [Akkermansiaceae bacterium]|nr:twin-arginine translocase TatA/TatE family subunit [Akkermansiaceae bacterium]